MFYKLFKKYEPTEPKFPGITGVLYLIDEETGTDWYDAIEKFDKDTMKVVVNKDGRIISASREADRLYPVDCSVAEVPMRRVPNDFDLMKAPFGFVNGDIVPFQFSAEDLERMHSITKSQLLSEASTQVGIYADMIAFEDDVEHAKEMHLAWSKYRILVNKSTYLTGFPAKPE